MPALEKGLTPVYCPIKVGNYTSDCTDLRVKTLSLTEGEKRKEKRNKANRGEEKHFRETDTSKYGDSRATAQGGSKFSILRELSTPNPTQSNLPETYNPIKEGNYTSDWTDLRVKKLSLTEGEKRKEKRNKANQGEEKQFRETETSKYDDSRTTAQGGSKFSILRELSTPNPTQSNLPET